MIEVLRQLWNYNRRQFVPILILNMVVSLLGSISIVMLIPMLDLLEISVGDISGLNALLEPFARLTFQQRGLVIISLFVLLILARAIMSRYATISLNRFLESWEKDWRDKLYGAIACADWQFISKKRHTDLVNLLCVQCQRGRACLNWTILLLTSFASAAMQLAIACWMSLPLTVIVLLVGGGFLWLFRPFQKRSKLYGSEHLEVYRSMHRELQEQLGSLKEIRAYHVEDTHTLRYKKLSQSFYDIGLKLTQMRVLPQMCYTVAAAVLVAFAFIISMFVLETGTAQLVILVYIFSRVWPMFSSWQGQLQNIQSALPALEKMQQSIDQLKAAEQVPPAEMDEVAFRKELSFRNVDFAYENAEQEALHNVSFDLPFGTVTALVGPSGAGKSTTADLLLGLLMPTSGEILVDGVAMSADMLQCWRKNIGYIPQAPMLLNDTVEENLLRFNPGATREQIIEALQKANAWSFVEKLPQGLDTVLGEKGTRLSGGERQRIVLARVLLGNPKLIILDEATSALDYESERAVRDTIQALRQKTTVLLIAHRLATIRTADRAIVMEQGTVVESGDLHSLLQKNDSYLARMVSVE